MAAKSNWTAATLRPEDLPAAVLAIAHAVDGLSAEQASEYSAFLCPPGYVSSAVLKMSGCALTVKALWRCLGVADQELWQPYVYNPQTGHYGAVSEVLAIGRRANALQSGMTPEAVSQLSVGDAVRIWSSGNNDHLFTLLEAPRATEDGWEAACLHGGQLTPKTAQGGKAAQAILKKETTFQWKSGKMWVGGRWIQQWICLGKLNRNLPATLPPGWTAFRTGSLLST